MSKENSKEEMKKEFMRLFTYEAGDGFRMDSSPKVPPKVLNWIFKKLDEYSSAYRGEENYWKQRCEAAERLIDLESPDYHNIFHKDFSEWQSLQKSESPKPKDEDAIALPKIVCLCGSTRFIEAFQEANLKFTCEGKIVLSVGCNTKSDRDLLFSGELTPELKMQLDELHKRKIDLADEVFVLNVGGYIGESTRSEIDYANKKGKIISYLEN